MVEEPGKKKNKGSVRSSKLDKPLSNQTRFEEILVQSVQILINFTDKTQLQINAVTFMTIEFRIYVFTINSQT